MNEALRLEILLELPKELKNVEVVREIERLTKKIGDDINVNKKT
jgi:predicted amino acid-binding ACT domain protein